jgi:DNA-binding XRE family transcriptional regulator
MVGAIWMADFDPAAAKEEFRPARLPDRPATARSGELQQGSPLLRRDGSVELIERDSGGHARWPRAFLRPRGDRAHPRGQLGLARIAYGEVRNWAKPTSRSACRPWRARRFSFGPRQGEPMNLADHRIAADAAQRSCDLRAGGALIPQLLEQLYTSIGPGCVRRRASGAHAFLMVRQSVGRPAMLWGTGRNLPLIYSLFIYIQDCHLLNGSLEPTLKPSLAMARKRQPDSRNDIGERLRVTREALGLSQAELCRRLGISPAAWNNAETGDNRIGIDNAMLLCKTTGVTLDWIYLGHRGGLPQKLAVDIERLLKRRR